MVFLNHFTITLEQYLDISSFSNLEHKRNTWRQQTGPAIKVRCCCCCCCCRKTRAFISRAGYQSCRPSVSLIWFHPVHTKPIDPHRKWEIWPSEGCVCVCVSFPKYTKLTLQNIVYCLSKSRHHFGFALRKAKRQVTLVVKECLLRLLFFVSWLGNQLPRFIFYFQT